MLVNLCVLITGYFNTKTRNFLMNLEYYIVHQKEHYIGKLNLLIIISHSLIKQKKSKIDVNKG